LKIKRICPTCGKEFETEQSRINDGRGKYCSRKCLYKSKEKNVIRKCEVCGKKFKTFPCKINQGNGKYCSWECYGESRKKKETTKCEFCEKEFKKPNPYRVKKGGGKYCSKECYSKAMENKIIKICEYCGKEFETYPSLINYGGGKYCSSECYGKSITGENSSFWKGGISFDPYCPKFNNRRKEAVRNFFGRKCIACGSDEVEFKARLPVHHIDHDKEQGCDGKPFNLVPLCIKCHGKELAHEEEFKIYINKTLREGFKWGIWNEEEYMNQVMYPED